MAADDEAPAGDASAPSETDPAAADSAPPLAGLSIPDDASDAEAAAIAAAVGAHLRDGELAAAADDDATGGRDGTEWALAGRIERLRGRRDRPVRIPPEAPADPWCATARRDRF